MTRNVGRFTAAALARPAPARIWGLQALVLAVAIVLSWAGSVRAADFAVVDPATVQAVKQMGREGVGGKFIARAIKTVNRAPAPVSAFRVEGTLPGDPQRTASIKAERDFPVMLDQAVAYRITGDPRHLATLNRYFDAWTAIYSPTFNPIDETRLDVMIMAFDLSREDLDPAVRDRFVALMRKMAEGYLSDMEGKYATVVHNWQSHRVKLATMSAYETGDAALITRAGQAYQRQVDGNVYADGTVYDYHSRDAIHYLTYDVNALMIAALAARGHGHDWFSYVNPNGGSLGGVLAWLTPYALGEQTHQEFVNSTVKFDAQRAAAGQTDFSGTWDRADGAQTFTLATLFSTAYRPTLEVLIPLPGAKVSEWLMLLCTVKSAPGAACPAGDAV